MSELRLGLLGCGQIGRLHAQRILQDGRGRLVAVCDPHHVAAEQLARNIAPDAQVFTVADDLIQHAALDGLVVCTPTDQHFSQTQTARARGLPVLCEKPLCDSRERLVELIHQAQSGPALSVAYQRRYWPPFRTLRREVLSGKWGAVKAVTINSLERWEQTIGGTWRDDPAQNPGGFIADAGSHKLDMLFFTTGLKPSWVMARSERRGSHVEIVTHALGELTSGAALSLSFVGAAQHLREDFHIHCEGADLMVREEQAWIARDNRFEPLDPLEPGSDPNRAFIDLLLEAGPNAAPPECALPVWDLTQAILEAARTGQRIGCASTE